MDCMKQIQTDGKKIMTFEKQNINLHNPMILMTLEVYFNHTGIRI